MDGPNLIYFADPMCSWCYGFSPVVAQIRREFGRGLPIRLALRRDCAVAELQLGEQARFFPSDAALSSWIAQADQGAAQIVYD